MLLYVIIFTKRHLQIAPWTQMAPRCKVKPPQKGPDSAKPLFYEVERGAKMDDQIAAWLDYLASQRGRPPSTQREYHRDVRLLVAHLVDRDGRHFLAGVTRQHGPIAEPARRQPAPSAGTFGPRLAHHHRHLHPHRQPRPPRRPGPPGRDTGGPARPLAAALIVCLAIYNSTIHHLARVGQGAEMKETKAHRTSGE